MNSTPVILQYRHSLTSVFTGALLVLVSASLLSGCGSTNVYTPEKTVEFQGSIYNISDVKQLSTRLEAAPSAGEVINLQGYDSKKFEALVKEKGPLTVSSIIALDDTVIVYRQKQIEKGRDFSKMKDELNRAYSELTRFMADAKRTQLKL